MQMVAVAAAAADDDDIMCFALDGKDLDYHYLNCNNRQGRNSERCEDLAGGDALRKSRLVTGGSSRQMHAFGSMTLSQTKENRGHPVPLFLLASAAETQSKTGPSGPAWRITLGNLAAGAVSGCAVEAGEVV